MTLRSLAHERPRALWLLLSAPGLAAWWVLLFALVAPRQTSNWLFPIAFEAVNYTTPVMLAAGLVMLWTIVRRR